MVNRMNASLIFSAMESGKAIRVYERNSNESFYGVITQMTKADLSRSDRWVITMNCGDIDEYLYIEIY